MMMIKRLAGALVAALTLASGAFAADKPLVIESGQVKQLPSATSLQLQAPTTSNATINLPHGTAPTSPANGDCWTTTGGLYCRINGTTLSATSGITANSVTFNSSGGASPGASFNGSAAVAVDYSTVGAQQSFTVGNGLSLSGGVLTATGAVGTQKTIVSDTLLGISTTFTASTSAFAAKGSVIKPTENFDLLAIQPYFTPVNGATYKCVALQINGSNVVTAVAGTTASLTISGTTTGVYRFKFASPVTVSAGSTYAIMLVRTDSTTTYALPLFATGLGAGNETSYRLLPTATATTILRIASVNPGVGDTLDNNSGTVAGFFIGIVAQVSN